MAVGQATVEVSDVVAPNTTYSIGIRPRTKNPSFFIFGLPQISHRVSAQSDCLSIMSTHGFWSCATLRFIKGRDVESGHRQPASKLVAVSTFLLPLLYSFESCSRVFTCSSSSQIAFLPPSSFQVVALFCHYRCPLSPLSNASMCLLHRTHYPICRSTITSSITLCENAKRREQRRLAGFVEAQIWCTKRTSEYSINRFEVCWKCAGGKVPFGTDEKLRLSCKVNSQRSEPRGKIGRAHV